MRKIISRRLTGLIQSANSAIGTLDVAVYRSDLHDFVVITDPVDNQGMSITNAVEEYLPQIVGALGLNGRRCIFIESHQPEPGSGRVDPSFDRICVNWGTATEGGLRSMYSAPHQRTIEHVPLIEEGWRQLAPELARALRGAGCEMTRLMGRRVRGTSLELQGVQEGVVTEYTGRFYWLDGGQHVDRISHVQTDDHRWVDARTWARA